MHCGGFVPVALGVIILTIMRYALYQTTSKKKDTVMEHTKKNAKEVKIKIKNGIKSMIETVWAIGTSIAGTEVLVK